MKYKKNFLTIIANLATITLLALAPSLAKAGAFELGFGFSFNRSTYSQGYNFTRRWSTTLGYHFSERSGIELGFQDIIDRTVIKDYEDTTFHDRIFSANWVQSFFPKEFPIQPYVKLGIGQLNRDATGFYYNGLAAPPSEVDSLTGILGVGLRIHITKLFSIRSELSSYLVGGRLNTYKDNIALSVGLSFFY